MKGHGRAVGSLDAVLVINLRLAHFRCDDRDMVDLEAFSGIWLVRNYPRMVL